MKKTYRRDMKKLTFICLPGLDSFLWDIARALAEEYEVRVKVSNNAPEIRAAVNDTDIVWLEWANEGAITALSLPEIMGKRVVLRLHSYEALSGYLPHIAWEKVNTLVCVAPHMAEICEMMLPGIASRVNMVVIPNGIDLAKHPFTKRAKGYNIAWVCDISHKKGPELVPQVLLLLTIMDDRYHLHIAGAFQEPRYEIYLKHMFHIMRLEEHVTFHGHLNAEQMEEFWRKQYYILSCSPHEGHPYNIMEAMARGIKPLIHNFYGADKLYPLELLWNTTADAVEMASDRGYDSKAYREHVISRGWTLEAQMASIRRMLEEL
jgi:glycosyltransferase involved in cell wall biosynthesis